MGLRKKRTVRKQAEERLSDVLSQADELRGQIAEQIAERAPEVRDAWRERFETGVAEIRARYPDVRDSLLEKVPELSEETYDKLPSKVAERLPEQVKPKKKRLRKVATLGLIAGAGAAVFAIVRRGQAAPPAQPSPYPAPAPTPPGPAPAKPAAAAPADAEPQPSAPPVTAEDILDEGDDAKS